MMIPKDWAGRQFNLLTFIERDQRKTTKGQYLWKLLCKCGEFTYQRPNAVARGWVKSCGCLRGNSKEAKPYQFKTVDKTGQRSGRLVFVQPTSEKKNNAVVWELLCDCGQTTFKQGDAVSSGNITSCGCLPKETASANGKKTRKQHPMISTAKNTWSATYKNGDIDFDTFFTLSQLDCHYCGRQPYRTTNIYVPLARKGKPVSDYAIENGNFTYNGLDRIDSSKAHTKDNVVPCCYDCNSMKSDMPYDKFIIIIKLIYHHITSLSGKHATNVSTTSPISVAP